MNATTTVDDTAPEAPAGYRFERHPYPLARRWYAQVVHAATGTHVGWVGLHTDWRMRPAGADVQFVGGFDTADEALEALLATVDEDELRHQPPAERTEYRGPRCGKVEYRRRAAADWRRYWT